jgi:hypothetical protein
MASWPYAVRLLGRWPALVGMGLLALDPFAISHQRVLHLDGLMSGLMLLSVLALVDGVSRPESSALSLYAGNHGSGSPQSLLHAKPIRTRSLQLKIVRSISSSRLTAVMLRCLEDCWRGFIARLRFDLFRVAFCSEESAPVFLMVTGVCKRISLNSSRSECVIVRICFRPK